MLKMQIHRQDFFTIPNLMGYFRILLIPAFAYTYLTAETEREYLLAAVLVGLSGLTDLFDGKIARRLNQITELGKLLDPLADKLTLGVILLCLATRYPLIWSLVLLFIIKEGFMGIMGALTLYHNGHKLDGALWFGKVCTAFLYSALFFLLIFPSIPLAVADVLIVLCALIMLWTLFRYLPVFHRMWKLPPQ